MAASPVKRKRSGSMAGLVLVSLAAGSGGSIAVAQQSGQPEQPPSQGIARMMDSNGSDVGRVQVRELAQGTLFVVELDHLPGGAHAIHVHENGACEPPAFESAGSHYAPLDNEHGFAHDRGHHAGDLPNVHASDNGRIRAEFFTPHLAVQPQRGRDSAGDVDRGSAFAPEALGPFELLDDDGSAIVVHANPDDYQSQDSGNSGGRIACGVIEPSGDDQGGGGQSGGQGESG